MSLGGGSSSRRTSSYLFDEKTKPSPLQHPNMLKEPIGANSSNQLTMDKLVAQLQPHPMPGVFNRPVVAIKQRRSSPPPRTHKSSLSQALSRKSARNSASRIGQDAAVATSFPLSLRSSAAAAAASFAGSRHPSAAATPEPWHAAGT